MTVLRGGKGPPQHIASSFLPIGFLEERNFIDIANVYTLRQLRWLKAR